MRSSSMMVTAACVLVAGSMTARAGTIMVVTDSVNNLLQIDVQTGVVSRLGGTDAQFTDIAFTPDGGLYGVTADYFYEIDPANGWSTLITRPGQAGFGGATGIDALTADQTGVLYGAGDDVLITIDPATGQATRLGDLSGYRSAGDLAVDATGRLLLTTDSGDLVEVARDGSGALPVGQIPYSDVFALGSNAAGDLYGVRSTNEVVSIDPATGQAAVIASLHAEGFLMGRIWGGSFPGRYTPEPTTLILWTFAALVVVGRKQTKT